jgi:arylsulfatase B
VITDGVPDQLPTNIRTVADLLKTKGWATAAFGKWDVGMTTWGCTPLCRGFDRHGGFYNADEEYFSHHVGAGALDLRLDFAPDRNSTGVYSTDLFGQRAIDFINEAVAGGAQNSFSYLAFQAIHGPQQAPTDLVETGFCADAIPATSPVRRVACGQMRSLDLNVARVVAAYKALGIWDQTLVILSADNGGNTDTGGSNYPLRGAKATMFEGGMRAACFASGAGLEAVAGTVSHAFYSLVDWLPTIVHGIAGVDLAEAALPKHAFQPAPPPLDGVDIWTSLSTGAPSPRTTALLYLDPAGCFTGSPPVPCDVPGQAALRDGNYKIISGHIGQYMSATTNVSSQFCGPHDGGVQPLMPALNVTKATSPPFCPAGWTLPPGSPGPAVIPPPEEAGAGGACTSTPCRLPSSSPLLAGGVFLFDVVNDPYEQHELSAQEPAIAARLLAMLQAFNATGIPQAHSAQDPASNPSNFDGVWTPWRGNPTPSVCDPNTTVAPTEPVDSNFDGATFAGAASSLAGWAWSPSAAGGGVAPLSVSFVIDGHAAGSQVANVPRPPAFMNKTGAPNVEHGFEWPVPEPYKSNITAGSHTLRVFVTAPDGTSVEARRSPYCIGDKQPVRCSAPQ